jgi:excisionase family DNA binding protein
MGNTIRIGEAAKILNVSPQTVRNLEKSGQLKASRSIGKQRYFSPADLKKFSLNIQALGLAWAISAQPPELPSEFYCERPDHFTSRVAKMGAELQMNKLITEDLASLLTLVAGEIGDNSFAHNIGNWPDVMGIFFAYDFNKRIIVLADRGRGVMTTLRQVRPNLATDTDSLMVAFNEIISGRNPEKRGNGLKVVRKVVEVEDIGLIFRSGIGTVTIPKESGSIKITMSDQNIRGAYATISF